MARGPSKEAKNAVTNENRVSGDLEGRAKSLEDTLEPTLKGDIMSPQGYGTAGVNAMNTAAQQAAGGATAGAVGSGFLRAARTRNRGGFDAAADEAARSGQREGSQRAVEIQGENERAKLGQRSSAISGLEGLYGTDLSGSLKAMGLVPETINAETNAGKSGWFQNFLNLIQTLNPSGKAGPISFGG